MSKNIKTEMLPFFVYGTLRTGQGNYNGLLRGRTEREVPAVLPSAKMYSQGIAFVTDSHNPNEKVIGDLIWVKDVLYSQVKSNLDGLEGYDEDDDDGHYLRVKRPVVYTEPETGEENRVMAWVYFGSPFALSCMTEKNRVMSGDWVAWREERLRLATSYRR